MNGSQHQKKWSVDDAAELYGIPHWGLGYFGVNDRGEVTVQPGTGTTSHAISLLDVVKGLEERGLTLPVLLRLSNLLDARIEKLHGAFADAIHAYGYKGSYRGVYPIKVNQQEQVIEELTRFGRKYHHGLEAGSKAELIAAMAYLDDPEAYLVCNGYKDVEFIDLGLYAVKLGIRCVFVAESLREVSLILARAEEHGVEPILGLRLKLFSEGSGHWNASGGDRSPFGLNAAQVMEAVDLLKERGRLDCLRLLHYHIGSQVPDIRHIRAAVLEASRIYAGLVGEGAPMGILDLGGGLAVDYDGSHTNFASSRNYTIEEYCADVIENIKRALDAEHVAHPTVITESGRATVAYYSVLLFNVLDAGRFLSTPLPESVPSGSPAHLESLLEASRSLSENNVQECYHDVLYYRNELRQLFKHGGATLRDLALGEKIFWCALADIADALEDLEYVPDEFEGLESALADYYYCNFSVFQSLPDAWAIEQLFPVLPIHRLDERPTRKAILADITCDCDGKIDRFIDLRDVKHSLPVHPLKAGEEYYLGAFLVGAYQETLGDLHNLMGDTNVVSVRVDEEGRLSYSHEQEGDSVADVLSYVEYEPRKLLRRVRSAAERAVQEGRVTAQERREILDTYEKGLRGYTYFEN
jgi:arginine decarboxylase